MAMGALFSATDEQMMWRVKLEGDPDAFARLVARWQTPIQRLCARMTGDAHRAEDISQMVFARVFAKRAEWEPIGKFSTFLWQVALNLCHDELRKVNRRGECVFPAGEEEGDRAMDAAFRETAPTPDAQAESGERCAIVRGALERLEPHYREVVVLRHYEGLKFCEIAEVLGIPEGTVKSRMAEALSKLNRLLSHLKEETLCDKKSKHLQLRAV